MVEAYFASSLGDVLRLWDYPNFDLFRVKMAIYPKKKYDKSLGDALTYMTLASIISL
jgi:hypothetical protein